MPRASTKSSKPKNTLAKKQNLRKFKLVSGLIAFVIVAVGAAAASQLAKISQENRSSASGCQLGATSCSNSTGLLWECDGNSFQEKPGPVVCNQALVDANSANSSYNLDGSCKIEHYRCVDGREQSCDPSTGKWYDSSWPCGGLHQPAPGQTCRQYDFQCKDGKYSMCECDINRANCSWQRRSAEDFTCTSDYYGGESGGSGSNQGGSPQPPVDNTIVISGFVACIAQNGSTYAVEGAKADAYGWPNPSGWVADSLSGPTGQFNLTVPGNNDYAIRINRDWKVAIVKDGQRIATNGWKLGDLQAVHACTPKGAAGSINCTNLTTSGRYEGDGSGYCSTPNPSSYEVCKMGTTRVNQNFDFLFTSCGF